MSVASRTGFRALPPKAVTASTALSFLVPERERKSQTHGGGDIYYQIFPDNNIGYLVWVTMGSGVKHLLTCLILDKPNVH